jgi:cell division protein FtsI/penicillin-binding protein 2
MRNRIHILLISLRRRRNFASARRPHLSMAYFMPMLAGLAGALILVWHAREVAGAAGGSAGQSPFALDVFQASMAGERIEVPGRPGIHAMQAANGVPYVVAMGVKGNPPVRIDLCEHLLYANSDRLLPVRLGMTFDDVARLAGGARPGPLRNIVFTGSVGAPQLALHGVASADFSKPLQLRWQGSSQGRWIGDAPDGLLRDGWLVWGEGKGIRVQRRASVRCPRAGELVVQSYVTAPTARAMVASYAKGKATSAWLAPGSYSVPGQARRRVEDGALFDDLYAAGLVRLGSTGMAELAPRDLFAWRAAAPDSRAASLEGWKGVADTDAHRKLLERLYIMADGAFVRQQVAIFNSERRLLAWRFAVGSPVTAHGSAGGIPVASTGGMPDAASRLFDSLPAGWGPWQRLSTWPGHGPQRGEISIRLPQPARAGDRVRIMVAGSAVTVRGAEIERTESACSGSACMDADDVRVLTLSPAPAVRTVVVSLAPLDLAAVARPYEKQVRHLVANGVGLAWQALPDAGVRNAAGAPTQVSIADRNGTLLWQAGAPLPRAASAGLGPMLGLRQGHPASIAGMLGRMAQSGQAHHARLTIDLGLQEQAHAIVHCIGMRRGTWDGARCQGGAEAPDGRRAGLVLVDTETGEVLAAAGAGAGNPERLDWDEVRAFDRANPARSPLRLPAFQHDGGAHQSPGSTFKIVSALGLELAAKGNADLDSLLAGMPLHDINRLAAKRGFGFVTAGPSYPLDGKARITNYRDQHLDRRAADGRFGLAQAMTYSLNTWFAWSGELSDRSLFGRSEGGAPDLQALEPDALTGVRPIVDMAWRLGFGQAIRLDGGLLPADFAWGQWDALQASPSRIDPVHTRHELRQMAIGLRMQATPLQMAMVAGAVGQGRAIVPRLLAELDGRRAAAVEGEPLPVRLDRVRAGMKGVVEQGTAAGAFRATHLEAVRRGLSGKTGTSPAVDANGKEVATAWFAGWLEPGSLPGQTRRLAIAAFASHSPGTGGEHAAPMVAALFSTRIDQKAEQRGK